MKMKNSLSVDSEDHKARTLLPLWAAVVFFVTAVSIIRYIYFRDILLISEGRPQDFNFADFSFYNLGWNFFLYCFKILLLGLVTIFGAFLNNVKKIEFSKVLVILLISELVKYLPELLKILWFTFFDSSNLEGYDLRAFDHALSLNGLLDVNKDNIIFHLFKYIDLTQLLYVLMVGTLFASYKNGDFWFHTKWFGSIYFSAILLLGLISILIYL